MSIVCANGHCFIHDGCFWVSSRPVTHAALPSCFHLDHLPLIGAAHESVDRNRAGDVSELHVEWVALAVGVERLLVEAVGPRTHERDSVQPGRLRSELVDGRRSETKNVLPLDLHLVGHSPTDVMIETTV